MTEPKEPLPVGPFTGPGVPDRNGDIIPEKALRDALKQLTITEKDKAILQEHRMSGKSVHFMQAYLDGKLHAVKVMGEITAALQSLFIPTDPEAYARDHEGACTDLDDPPPGGRASDYHWMYAPFCSLELFGDLKEWADWMREEVHMWYMEGQPDRYRRELEEPIAEPVVAVEVDGKLHLWDGNHRVGGSACAGRKTVPAVIGIPKNEKSE